MELIYIDSDEQACQTNLRKSCDTNAITLATFRAYRRYGVPFDQARFLLDYHNAKGDLSDTIAISADGFKAITGEHPKTDEEYRKIDTDFWNEARSPSSPLSSNTRNSADG
ncbi:hypothetical protein [Bradyrhizobium sp. 930_D9_N1_4]|uniref:hypothetical protein n=1 Tax=Bradyrhizobium sp. 930_D9_N1_4 TaxID=3240374 RepID=UPI003F8B8C4A